MAAFVSLPVKYDYGYTSKKTGARMENKERK